MVVSGAKPNQAAMEGFQRVVSGQNRWAIFKFDWSKGQTHPETGKKLDQDVVTVSEVGSAESSFSELRDKIALDQCLYIAFDCHYKTDKDQERKKVLLVAWSNDECHGAAACKMKMLLSSTEKEVIQKFTGFAKKCTINSVDDLTEENFVDIVSSGKTK